MPKTSGFELYDKMKRIDGKVKVCLMSGSDINSNDLREQFPSLEIECSISKPIQVKKLVKRIETKLLRKFDK
jgi:response regulator RpfG family c-di-GMP phosphodiesterase